jgi:DNA-binding response OmpR family regulator
MDTSAQDEAELSVVWVEEDESLARSVAGYLGAHNVSVRVHPDVSHAIASILRSSPDVVLLDVPSGASSLDACRIVRRRSDAPIIVTAKEDREIDRVLGLEAGADDWLAKPFSSRELLARIRARARRARARLAPRTLRVGSITIDRAAMTATLDGVPLTLTTYEFMLLHTLAERAGIVVSREDVVGRVRGDVTEAFERSVDIHISHLRAKLGDDPRRPRFIRTVRGVGYMLTQDSPRCSPAGPDGALQYGSPASARR